MFQFTDLEAEGHGGPLSQRHVELADWLAAWLARWLAGCFFNLVNSTFEIVGFC